MDLYVEQLQTEKDILKVLRAFDQQFPRSISSRVDSLESHARKLAAHACVYRATKEGSLAGFVAFYANDTASATGFLTHLAVDPQFRGTGVGQALMQQCIFTSKSEGMGQIRLEVDSINESAIAFYRSLGFTVEGAASPESIFMLRVGL